MFYQLAVCIWAGQSCDLVFQGKAFRVVYCLEGGVVAAWVRSLEGFSNTGNVAAGEEVRRGG